MAAIHPIILITVIVFYDLIAACGFWFFLTFLQSSFNARKISTTQHNATNNTVDEKHDSDLSQARSKFPKNSLIIFASLLFFPTSCSVNKTLRYVFTPDNMYFVNSRVDNTSYVIAFVILCVFLFFAHRFFYRQSS